MRGASHYDEAERLAEVARTVIKDADELRDGNSSRDALMEWDSAHSAARTLLMLADVHATLALASATEKATAYAHNIDVSGYGR